MINPDKLKLLQANKDKLPPEVRAKIGKLLEERSDITAQEESKDSFMTYVNYVWPNFIHGRHHVKMAEAFERVANGTCKRLIINMPPRHTKSEFASYLLRLGSWASTHIKKLFRPHIPLSLLSDLDEKSVTWLIPRYINAYFLRLNYSLTLKLLAGGTLTLAETILRLVLVVRLRVKVLIYSLLTTLTRNKRPH